MAQVITPPTAGEQEQVSKNWYRSEALRKIQNDLKVVHAEIDDVQAKAYVDRALELLGDARVKLNPQLKRKRLGGS